MDLRRRVLINLMEDEDMRVLSVFDVYESFGYEIGETSIDYIRPVRNADSMLLFRGYIKDINVDNSLNAGKVFKIPTSMCSNSKVDKNIPDVGNNLEWIVFINIGDEIYTGCTIKFNESCLTISSESTSSVYSATLQGILYEV